MDKMIEKHSLFVSYRVTDGFGQGDYGQTTLKGTDEPKSECDINSIVDNIKSRLLSEDRYKAKVVTILFFHGLKEGQKLKTKVTFIVQYNKGNGKWKDDLKPMDDKRVALKQLEYSKDLGKLKYRLIKRCTEEWVVG